LTILFKPPAKRLGGWWRTQGRTQLVRSSLAHLPLWLSSDVIAGRVLLAVSVAAGIALRFYRLDAISMTADEGAAWAAAVEPVRSLLRLQPQLDAGKLAVYDLLLHYWIAAFGDSLRALRSLSAVIDTISIGLMFIVVRELYRAFAPRELTTGELAGGFAAFLFATSVALVQSARTARMYPLMTAAELAQIFFFVRAQRRGGLMNCILTACSLALAIAANFTAVFLLAGEGLWLAYLLAARWKNWSGRGLQIAAPALSLAAGLVLLLPFAPAAVAVARTAVADGALNWIRYQPPWSWAYDILRNGAGNKSLFRLLLALAAFGLWRNRNTALLAPMFLVAAAIGPFAAVAIMSLLGRPMMVERYVLLALIAFLGLAATGAAAFESAPRRIVVFLLLACLSVRALRHWSGFWVDWQKAAAIAYAGAPANAAIGVVPGYAVYAVRYNLPPEQRLRAMEVDSQCGGSQILIVSPGRPLTAARLSILRACYPRLLGRATRVEVRAR
jgi:mannosyltransferase